METNRLEDTDRVGWVADGSILLAGSSGAPFVTPLPPFLNPVAGVDIYLRLSNPFRIPQCFDSLVSSSAPSARILLAAWNGGDP